MQYMYKLEFYDYTTSRIRKGDTNVTLKKRQTEHCLAKDQLLKELAIAKNELDCAYSNFDNVTNDDLIDCYIYEINAVQKRYKFLLDRAQSLEEALNPQSPEGTFVGEALI